MLSFDTRCRCCLGGLGNTQYRLFDYKDPETNLPVYTRIKNFLDVSGEEFTKLKICIPCSDLLDSAYKFQSICLKTELELNKELEASTSLEDVIIKKEINVMPLDTVMHEEEMPSIENPFIESIHDDSNSNREMDFPEPDPEPEYDMPEAVEVETKIGPSEMKPAFISCLKLSDELFQKEHPNIHLTCQKCNMLFENAEEMIAHKSVNCTVKKYRYNPTQRTNVQCSLCERYFNNKRGLDKHLAEYPNCEDEVNQIREINAKLTGDVITVPEIEVKEEMMEQDEIEELSPYSCAECNLNFSSEKMLNLHNKFKHSSTFTCKVCDETFNNKELLTLHFRQIHVYDCTECDLKFIVEEQLERHYQEEHPEEGAEDEEGEDEGEEGEGGDDEEDEDDPDEEL